MIDARDILKACPQLAADPVKPAKAMVPARLVAPAEELQAFVARCEDRGFCSRAEAHKLIRLHGAESGFFDAMSQLLHRDERFKPEHPCARSLLATTDSSLAVACLWATTHQEQRTLRSSWELFQRLLPTTPPSLVPSMVGRISRLAEGFHSHLADRPFPFEYWPEVECVLAQSRYPGRDLALLHDRNGRPRNLTAERLSQHYADGNGIIPHLEYFGPFDDPEHAPPRLGAASMGLLQRLAALPRTREDNEPLRRRFEALEPALQPYVLQAIDAAIERSAPIDWLPRLIGTLYDSNLDPAAKLAAASSLPHLHERIGEGVEQLQRLADEARHAGDRVHFQTQVAAAFETLNLDRLRATRAGAVIEPNSQYAPGRDELRGSFLAPGRVDAPPLDAQRLERALEQAEGVKRRMTELRAQPWSKTAELMRSFCYRSGDKDPVEFFALAQLAHERALGFHANHTQLVSMLLLAAPQSEWAAPKRWAEIGTGEGKTLTLAMLASYFGVQGRRVHVVTNDEHYARRDCAEYQDYFGMFRRRAEHFSFDPRRGVGHVVHDARILYTDQASLVHSFISSRLRGELPLKRDLMLLDEADVGLVHTTSITHAMSGTVRCGISQPLHLRLRRFVEERGAGAIGADLVGAAEEARMLFGIRSASPEVVALRLHALIHAPNLREQDHYVVIGDKVTVLDRDNTGRLLRTEWRHGMMEEISLRHGLPYKESHKALAELTFPLFFDLYAGAICVSGTFGGAETQRELHTRHGLDGFKAPPHRPSRLALLPDTICADRETYHRQLLERAQTLLDGEAPRAWLHLAPTVRDAVNARQFFAAHGRKAQLLTDVQNLGEDGLPAGEETVIRRAGDPGVLTIATIAGRNTDISPSTEVLQRGGLHTSMGYFTANEATLAQARGRPGRQGWPGSFEIIADLSSDPFLSGLTPDIQAFISETVTAYGERSKELQSTLDFVRRAEDLCQARARDCGIERDRQVQKVIEYYFDLISKSGAELRSGCSYYTHRPSTLADISVSRWLSEAWSDEFEAISTRIHYHGILERNGPAESPLSPESEHGLRRAFRASFGCDPLDQLDPASFAMRAVRLAGMYRNQLHAAQTTLSTLSEEQFGALFDELRARMDARAAAATAGLIEARGRPPVPSPAETEESAAPVRPVSRRHTNEIKK